LLTPRKSVGAAIASRSPSRHDRRDDVVSLEQVGRIRAAEERIEEPAVPLAVDAPRCRLVLGRVGRRVRVREVERDPHLDVWSRRPDRLHRPAVREEHVMRRRDRVCLACAARRVLAPRVTDPRVNPGLVVGDPVLHAVAQPPDDGLRVLDERLRRLPCGPAARVLERLRRVPVEERRERLDAVREQLVDEAVVEVEPACVDRPAPVGMTRGHAIEKRNASSPSSRISATSSR
jgi:hypothetical protein